MKVSSKLDYLALTVKDKKTDANGGFVYPLIESKPWNWREGHSSRFYNTATVHHSGLLVMRHTERPEMGVHVIYSGSTLDNLRQDIEFDGWDILQYHHDEGHTIKRVDCALDVYDEPFEIGAFESAFDNGDCVTSARSGELRRKSSGDATYYVGSRKKIKKLLRVYDKGKELGLEDLLMRIELDCRKQPAQDIASELVSTENKHDLIVGLIRGFADFPGIPLWEKVMNSNPQKIDMPAHKTGKTEKWLLNQVAPAFAREMLNNPDIIDRFIDAVSINLEKLEELPRGT